MVVEVPEAPLDTAERLRRSLGESPIYELREVTAAIEDGRVVLRGSVSSFYHKQLAQEAVRSIVGSHRYEIVNRVTVRGTSSGVAAAG